MNVPLFKIEFPELERLSEGERRSIVASCLEADGIKLLQKRSMLCMRVCWSLLAASAIGSVVLLQSGVSARVCALLAAGVFSFSVLALALCIYLFHSRTRQLLRKLIAEKTKTTDAQ